VVLEFKTKVTTHDVLTYSTKAEKHKTIYPYLRYGLVLSGDKYVPKRFFTHNEGLDFCMCTEGTSNSAAARAFELLLQEEIECCWRRSRSASIRRRGRGCDLSEAVTGLNEGDGSCLSHVDAELVGADSGW